MRRRLVPLVLLVACGTPAPDLDRDRAELLRLHAVARTAHVDKRADLMVTSFDDSLLSVSGGEVTVASPVENRTRLQAYFDRSTAPDSTGRPVAEDVVYAWVEIYEKPQDRWILKAVASTDRPGP